MRIEYERPHTASAVRTQQINSIIYATAAVEIKSCSCNELVHFVVVFYFFYSLLKGIHFKSIYWIGMIWHSLLYDGDDKHMNNSSFCQSISFSLCVFANSIVISNDTFTLLYQSIEVIISQQMIHHIGDEYDTCQ